MTTSLKAIANPFQTIHQTFFPSNLSLPILESWGMQIDQGPLIAHLINMKRSIFCICPAVFLENKYGNNYSPALYSIEAIYPEVVSWGDRMYTKGL